MEFCVQFRQLVRLIVARLRYVSDSGGLDNVTDNKFLDRLVLWDASSAIGATDRLDMTTAMLGASSVSTFAGLK